MQPPAQRFVNELQQMRDMGFYDDAANLRGMFKSDHRRMENMELPILFHGLSFAQTLSGFFFLWQHYLQLMAT